MLSPWFPEYIISGVKDDKIESLNISQGQAQECF